MLLDRNRTRFHLTDIKQFVHKPRQPRRFVIDCVVEDLLLFKRDIARQRKGLRICLDICKRRTKLVCRSEHELFTRLFARTATPRIVRFLSDRASFIDRVAVAASLPTGLFLRQLLGPAPRKAMQALLR